MSKVIHDFSSMPPPYVVKKKNQQHVDVSAPPPDKKQKQQTIAPQNASIRKESKSIVEERHKYTLAEHGVPVMCYEPLEDQISGIRRSRRAMTFEVIYGPVEVPGSVAIGKVGIA
ncbi:hypothetical protein HAX54_007866 [Datura stramonium]|uniref:Uncharacterized protein n=1 Tax=Datura stramonium TaxID=4076 RepID=A0ABS8WUV2_DATST|nr:hypothetical protein [Datura stramonium]